MNLNNQVFKAASLFGIAMSVWLFSLAAHASYTICAVGSIRTTDSGNQIPSGPNAGDTEDYWQNGDSTLSKAIHGLSIGVYRPGAGNEYRNTGSDGCADFTGTAGSGSTVTFYSHTLAQSTGLVLNNSPYSYALNGATWTYRYTNQNLRNNRTYTYSNLGSGLAKWTTLFTANFGLRRFDDALNVVSNWTTIYLGLDESCTTGTNGTDTVASAHYGGSGSNRSNGQITSGRHYLALANCTTGGQRSRQKFIVSHEMGHAITALYYGASSGATNGDEPNSTDYSKDRVDGETGTCRDGGTSGSDSYTIDSKEWNSVGFREGFAHWVAASSWSLKNDSGAAGGSGTGQEGSFSWFGGSQTDAHDLERYNLGAGSGSGGHLENICTTGWDSSSTNGDWLRFLWDMFTDTTCGSSPSKNNMLDVYSRTRQNGGLTKGNYFTRAEQAANNLWGSCWEGRFATWSSWNGVDNDT